jgi:hypothetical protein
LCKKKARKSETITKNSPSKNYGLYWTSPICTPKSSTSSYPSAASSLMNSLKPSKGLSPKSTPPKSKPQSKDFHISGDSLGLSTKNYLYQTDNLENSTRWDFS